MTKYKLVQTCDDHDHHKVRYFKTRQRAIDAVIKDIRIGMDYFDGITEEEIPEIKKYITKNSSYREILEGHTQTEMYHKITKV